MPIVFRCNCGRKLQVKDEAAGKACVCPQCGEKVRIPAANAEDITTAPAKTAATRSAPVKARTKPVAPPPDEDDEDERPEPRVRKRRKKAAAPVIWPWIAGGAVLLLVVVGVTLWLLLRSPKAADKVASNTDKKEEQKPPVVPDAPKASSIEKDLDLVDPNGMGFVTLQIAGFWNSPAGKKARELEQGVDQSKQLEQTVGVAPGNLQRMLVIIPRREPCVAITTVNPVPREAILSRVAPGAQQQQVRDRTYYVLPGRADAVHFVSDRLFLLGPQSDLVLLLDTPRATAPGALSPALAAADKHFVVVGVNAQSQQVKQGLQMAQQTMGDAAKGFSALLTFRSALLTFDFDTEMRAQLALTMPDAQGAEAAKPQMQALITLARFGMGQMKGQVPAEQKDLVEGVVVFLDALLNSAQIEQKDTTLQVTLRMEEKVYYEHSVKLIKILQGGGAVPTEAIKVNNLKQIGLALHSYHSTHGAFPAASISNAQGKPLLSWRVAILPYIEQGELYRQFKLDEPWDSPHNITLLPKMPAIYLSGAPGAPHNTTHFRAFAGPQALFPLVSSRPGPLSIGMKLTEVRDGTSNTFAIVEAVRPRPWTQPDEVVYNPQQPLEKFVTSPAGFHVLFADGTVRVISPKNDEQTIRAAITPSGGENMPLKE